MGRMVDVDDLVTAGVVVVRMGLSRSQRVHQLMRATPPMPDPVYVGPKTLLWAWSDVSAWAAETGRSALEPDDLVTREIVVARLGFDPADRSDVEPGTIVDGETRWPWGRAERVWIDGINRANG